MIRTMSAAKGNESIKSGAFVTAHRFDHKTMHFESLHIHAILRRDGILVIETAYAPPELDGNPNGEYIKQEHHRAAEKDFKTNVIVADDLTIRIEYRKGRLFVNGSRKWVIQ